MGFPDPIAIVQQARTLHKERSSSKPTTSTKAVKTKEPLRSPSQAKPSQAIRHHFGNPCIIVTYIGVNEKGGAE